MSTVQIRDIRKSYGVMPVAAVPIEADREDIRLGLPGVAFDPANGR